MANGETRDTKLLQAIINKLNLFESRFDDLEKEIKKNRERIDNLGLQLAEVDDDAPTGDEFSNLEKRVGKLEKGFASI